MSYAVIFDKDGLTIRLPVNPETVEITKTQSIENYTVLKLGQIAKSNGTELDKYSFEAEFPSKPYRYVLTSGEFKPADFYLQLFEKWCKNGEPVRLVISNGESDDISTLVLFESIDISENAGEEGDYNIAFELTEYKPFGVKEVVVTTQSTGTQKAKVTKASRPGAAPKPKTYTVASGDTLWSIAKRYLGDGEKYSELTKANPQIKNPSLIAVGQVIKLS